MRMTTGMLVIPRQPRRGPQRSGLPCKQYCDGEFDGEELDDSHRRSYLRASEIFTWKRTRPVGVLLARSKLSALVFWPATRQFLWHPKTLVEEVD